MVVWKTSPSFIYNLSVMSAASGFSATNENNYLEIISVLLSPHLLAECKITAGHWPISDHFSKMANQNFQHDAFTLYTWPIKFMKNWKNGRPFQISHFARCLEDIMATVGGGRNLQILC